MSCMTYKSAWFLLTCYISRGQGDQRSITVSMSATSSGHLSLSSALLRLSLKSFPVHSVMLSSHLFLFSCTVPCRIVLASPDHLVDLALSLWSEDLHEVLLPLWFCSVPRHLWCDLCMRCLWDCGSISSPLTVSFSPIRLLMSMTHRHIKILKLPVIISVWSWSWARCFYNSN